MLLFCSFSVFVVVVVYSFICLFVTYSFVSSVCLFISYVFGRSATSPGFIKVALVRRCSVGPSGGIPPSH